MQGSFLIDATLSKCGKEQFNNQKWSKFHQFFGLHFHSVLYFRKVIQIPMQAYLHHTLSNALTLMQKVETFFPVHDVVERHTKSTTLVQNMFIPNRIDASSLAFASIVSLHSELQQFGVPMRSALDTILSFLQLLHVQTTRALAYKPLLPSGFDSWVHQTVFLAQF